MSEPQYKRVLLKLSGEALAGEASRGLDFDVIGSVCDVIKKCVACGVQIGIVVGGGNFWRGVKDGGDRMERTRADHMGMLATTINALAVADVLEQKGVDVRVQTAIEMRAMAEPSTRFSPLTRPRCCGPRRSTRMPFCWLRTLTASTAPTRRRTPLRSSMTPSLMTMCWPSTCR